MIQRIQTLFLAAVVAISLSLYYLPLYSYDLPESPQRQDFFILGSTLLSVLNGLALLLAAVAVFLFRNRGYQLRLTSLNMLLVSVLIVTDFYFSDRPSSADSDLNFSVGSYLLLVELVLLWLAVRFIRKDERLVRSADRLR